MYTGIVHAHSGLRWILLLLLITAIVSAFTNRRSDEVSPWHRKNYLLVMVFAHIQLLLGIYLYFYSTKVSFGETTMSDTVFRFFSVEHTFGMLISIGLITFGHRTYKNAQAASKHKKILVYYGLALLIMLLSIPWPFRNLGADWF